MHDNHRVLPRFYAPELDVDAEFRLPAEEAHHLTRVLRLGMDDPVEVFDGRGGVYRAVVVEAARDRAIVRITEPLPAPTLPTPSLTVVQAVLKGSSMDDAVRDATMMGAAAIQPVMTEHVVVKMAQAMRKENEERWRRVALAAVKQCRRATVPQIRPVRSLEEWLASASVDPRLIFVEPSAEAAARPLRSIESPPAAASVLLGPEGGWSPREVAAAVGTGCVPVTLGPLTLRAESMPVAALAALAAVWGR
jgi:16S rRNA (uracil1498-N3)-methyltransferase